MKTLLTLLGSGLIAFAIGCGDQGNTSKPSSGPPPGMDPTKMQADYLEKMKTQGGATAAADGAKDAATDTTDTAAKDDTKEDAAKEDAPKKEDDK